MLSKYFKQFNLNDVPCEHISQIIQHNKRIGTAEGDEGVVLNDLCCILDQPESCSIAQQVKYLIERIHHSDPHEFGYDPIIEMTFTPQGYFAIY